ncbi:ShlB/FhaC/HecB family hemolysin secretion/activation protein [Leptotrichia sp. OH3620_COT-345]|uniref:ShlB/FhaC/HecB family hemolysin secretion/activation protein n=1 Tax=Leptotrichia sp. OH3620_COT-345 TaxID=2491048 RepID=UPI000F654BFD|nr:ShlB/FhaC/HecB family hemolysin secretion/activation protein [Leptotrichia sp. OH3620_COT-345]RRD38974.1 ShlB/FhaC/HecB family hemolysin secretion/activation protein [Leptotrichia sp. OH3620_COT-345]
MRKSLTLLFLFTSLFSLSAPEDEAIKIFEKEQQRLEQERRRIEQERKQREFENIKLSPSVQNNTEVVTDNTEPKFLIIEINLYDNENLLNGNEEFSVLRKYKYTYMGSTDIQKLLTELTNKIISKGYITSAVTVSKDNDLKTGRLNLEIIPGKVQEIIINSGNILDRYKEFFMFGINKGDVLNIRDIDTATENFNSLGSNNMTMEIVAGTKPNYSIIKIKNIMKDKYKLSLTGNNHGENNQSGFWRPGISLNIDSPLGIGDNFLFSYLTVDKKIPDRGWKKKASELEAGEILPIGPPGYDPLKGESLPYKRRLDMFTFVYTLKFREYTLKFNSSKSISESSFFPYNTVYDMKSASHTLSANMERVMWRNQRSKVSLGIGIKRKHNETYLEQSELSNRKLSIGNISLNMSTSIFKGLLGITLGHERGLGIFNAEKDKDKFDTTPKSRFKKYTVDINYYKPVTQKLIYRFNLTGSYSPDVMYGSERQTIGGVGSIGGYHRTGTLQGDRAIEVNSELSYNIPVFKKWGYFTPYISYGYGATQNNKDNSRYRIGYMNGLTVGVRYNSKFFDFDFGYAKAMKHSEYLKPESQEMYFSGAFKIIF